MAEAARFKGSPAGQGGQSRSQHDATVADEMFHSVIKLKQKHKTIFNLFYLTG